MTTTRLKVLKYFLFKRNHNVRLKEMFNFFFSSSYRSKALKVIERVEGREEFNVIYFKGLRKPLYYPSNFPLSSLNMVICESFYSDNWHYYEIPETSVSEDDIVVDCGAAEGLFGLLVADRCKKLYLIEPLKTFSNCLSRTFSANENVEVMHLGLSSAAGWATISENNISSAISIGAGTDIQISTLDKLFFEKDLPVTYLKIDVEGFDFEVLKGATELIKKYKPKIAVTTYHNFDHARLIEEFLISIVPAYKVRTKGIFQMTGSPVMLHAWV